MRYTRAESGRRRQTSIAARYVEVVMDGMEDLVRRIVREEMDPRCEHDA
jgi:hypothetical protein